jgi:hypothetical protein
MMAVLGVSTSDKKLPILFIIGGSKTGTIPRKKLKTHPQ